MDQLLENLRSIVGREDVLSDPDQLIVFECDGLTQHRHPPRAVVFPDSTEEVAAVVRELSRAGVHFVARGAGTGLSGGALAVGSGVVVETARMRRLLRVDPENRLAVVQTGMVNAHVSRAVAAHGLHYVPDPSSGTTCTVGGNVAENAGGIHCLKYGTTTDHILALRVVLSDGSVVDLGSASPSEPAGYDLVGVFVGSEGTFGVATEATVRLVPLPQTVRTMLADFADVNDASRAVSAIIAAGLLPAALEMVDGATIRAVEASVFAAGIPLDAGAALLIELDGLEAGLDEEVARAEAICREHGARNVRRAADEKERKRLWAARKGAFGAMGRLAPDMMLQDAVVPRSRLPEVLAETYRIGARHRLRLANVFHAGDGNLHPIISFDRRDRDELRRVEAANREIVEACVGAGGTLTGEHGVGLDKSRYMPLIFSADDLDAMLAVRAAFDPTGLCNPGKVIPAPRGCGEARAVATARPGSGAAAAKAAGTAESEVRGLQPEGIVPENLSRLGRQIYQETSAQGAVEAMLKEGSSLLTPEMVSRPNELFFNELRGIVGAENFDGGEAGLSVAPATTAQVREVMRAGLLEGMGVWPAGTGLWLRRSGRFPERCSTISLRRMRRIVAHEPADLVATVEPGVTLSELNAELARAGQWLPLDPPDDGRATVGGVVGTGQGGAQSFAYGLPRAFLLGLRAVLSDGREIRAGGRVVKNVAGYDLCKLFAGSYGTLGVITELTFKLRPLPERRATLVALSADAGTLVEGGRRLRAGQFLPSAFELFAPRLARDLGLPADDGEFALAVRFDGNERAVAAQLARAREEFARAGAGTVEELTDGGAAVWRALAAAPLGEGHDLRWRAGLLPTEAPRLLARLAASGDGEWGAPSGHASFGSGRVRVFHTATGEADAVARRLAELRREVTAGGAPFVVEHATAGVWRSLKALKVTAQALPEGHARLMREIKGRLDQARRLGYEAFDGIWSNRPTS